MEFHSVMLNYRVLRRSATAILSILIVFAPVAGQVARGQRQRQAPVDSARVEKAIQASIRHLLGTQLPDGGWPEYSHYRHGVTCLVTLALLNAGLAPDHPQVSRALQRIDGEELSYTYTASLQTMALCAANPAKYATTIDRNAKWLIENQLRDGGWGYGDKRDSGASDPSNSQFALLALHEAQRSGLKLADASWNEVFANAKRYWERFQQDDGSFPYTGTSPRGSMTCAGIASLVIAGAQTDGLESTADQTVMCCGDVDTSKNRIEMAIDWLSRNFTVRHNPNHANRYHLYYMYALERAGRLTGRRYIGDHDWYREGSEQLINITQDQISGKFISGSLDGNEYTETAFALLFLSKGKRQTLISRLKYPGQDSLDWNHHSTAVQNLTAHTEQAWKRDLSWQNVDLEKSTVKELLETPVLFISGTQAAGFTNTQKALLKEYTDQGGFIFVEACNGDGCQGIEFENYFRNLVSEVWDAELEKLPQDHPIWYSEARITPSDLPKDAWIYGVQTCCRLGIVYVPYSLSCRWELNLPYGAKPDYAELVQRDLDTATKLGLNVLAYATGKELQEKLDTVTILEKVDSKTPTRRGVFKFAKLKHNAGYDDAPRAAPNLIQWLNKTNPFRMDSEKLAISITPNNLKKYPLVFMHGRGRLVLSQEERDALRAYLADGDGCIIADAICADEEFAESFRGEMEIITGQQLKPLEISHPAFSEDYGGFDISRVKMIDPDQSGNNVVAATRTIQPRIEVARTGNRISVLFSPLDLSCALESRHSLQCRGYLREDAARIGINLILFAKQQY